MKRFSLRAPFTVLATGVLLAASTRLAVVGCDRVCGDRCFEMGDDGGTAPDAPPDSTPEVAPESGQIDASDTADPCAHDFGEIPLEADGGNSPTPLGIAVCGAPSSLWFTQIAVLFADNMNVSGAVRRIAGEQLDPPWSQSFGAPSEIAPGPDGRCWFVDLRSQDGAYPVVAFGAADAGVTSYRLPSQSLPRGLAAGPDGQMWITTDSGLWQVAPSGLIAQRASPGVQWGDNRITTGPDNRLWFTTLVGVGCLGCLSDAAVVTPFFPWGLDASRQPKGIVGTGIDTSLWVTEFGAGAVGKIATDGGLIKDFFLAPRDAGRDADGGDAAGIQPNGIAIDIDDNVWFTEYGADRIGWITTGGVLCHHELALGSGPYDITRGPGDGRMWFTETTSRRIGWIMLR
jgi:virginiamycin B lyase